MVLSCSSPCIQGIADPQAAAEMAVTVNNRLAAAISNNTERFGGFASLAMHNATVAAAELTRAIKELGFLGKISRMSGWSFLQDVAMHRCTFKRLSAIWIGWP